MAPKTTQQELIGKLRAQVKNNAEDWLRDHLPDKGAYISQNADIGVSPLSPSEFLRVRQIYDWERKKDFEQDSSPEVTVSSSFNTTLVSKIVEENGKLVILGEPGLGKSTVLRHLMYEYAAQSDKPLPLLIELKNYRHEINRLEDHINSYYKITIDKLKTQNVIFLLDGFNELPPSEQVELYIDLDTVLSDFSKSRFIVTSRKVSYPEDLRDWSTCEVLGLEEDKVQAYLKFLLGGKDSDKLYKKIEEKGLLPISSNPLFLSLIFRIYQKGKQLPNSKGELLNIIFRHDYLKEFSERKKIRAEFSIHLRELGDSRCLRIMSRVAHEVLLKTDGISFDEDFLYNVLGEEIGKYAFNIIDLFNQIRLIEKFEVEGNDGTKIIYSFWHQAFFEYFSGLYLKNIFEQTPRDKLQKMALPYFEFKKWDGPMKIAFALCGSETANALFSEALEIDFFLAIVYFTTVENRLSAELLTNFRKEITFYLTSWRSKYGYSLEMIRDEAEQSEYFSRYFIWNIDNIINKLCEKSYKDPLKAIREIDSFCLTLGRINHKTGVDFLKRVITNSKIKINEIKNIALRSLGHSKDTSVTPFLINITKKNKLIYRYINFDFTYSEDDELHKADAEDAKIIFCGEDNFDRYIDNEPSVLNYDIDEMYKELFHEDVDNEALVQSAISSLFMLGTEEAKSFLLALLSSPFLNLYKECFWKEFLLSSIIPKFNIDVITMLWDSKKVYIRMIGTLSLLSDKNLQAFNFLIENIYTVLSYDASVSTLRDKFILSVRYWSGIKTSLSSVDLERLKINLITCLNSDNNRNSIYIKRNAVIFICYFFETDFYEILSPFSRQLGVSEKGEIFRFLRFRMSPFIIRKLLEIYKRFSMSSLENEDALLMPTDDVLSYPYYIMHYLRDVNTPEVKNFFIKILLSEMSEDHNKATVILCRAQHDREVLRVYLANPEGGFNTADGFINYGEFLDYLEIFNRIDDAGLKKRIAILIYCHKQIFYKGDDTNVFSLSLAQKANRRFLYVEPLDDELDEAVKAFPPTESWVVGTEEIKNYARVWTKGSDIEGEPISKKAFDDYLNDRKSYKIFIIDEGEYELGSVGSVYLNNELIPIPQKRSKREIGEDIVVDEYRVLVCALKNNYVAGDFIRILRNCLQNPEKADVLQQKRDKAEAENQDGTDFREATGNERSLFVGLNKLLKNKIDIKFSSRRGVRALPKKIPFCILEKL